MSSFRKYLALALFLLLPLSGTAMVCIPTTLCSSYARSAVVFRGRVLEIVPDPNPGAVVTYPDGSKDTLYLGRAGATVRFEVLELFKGSIGTEVRIRSQYSLFNQGHQYVIFASLQPGTEQLVTGTCSGNVFGNQEWDAKLAWLRAYPTAPPTARIFGSSSLLYGDPDRPPLTIHLTGAQELTTTTDSQQKYEFSNLDPGTYTVTAIPAPGYSVYGKSSRTVNLEPKGCEEVDWRLLRKEQTTNQAQNSRS